MFLNVLGELSNFAMGTILGKTLAQTQVVTNHSTSAEGYDDEKLMRIPRFSGLRVPYWEPYTEVNQLLGYNFRKQRWKRQQPQAILTFFGYPKFLFFLLFPMGNFVCCTCTSIVSKVSLLFIVVKRECTRRLMGSTDHADPSCCNFRISWILMERRCFYFFFVTFVVCRASEVRK